MSIEEMRSTYDNDVSKYTYMISPSSFTTEVFQSAFRINKERLIETGYPRNDILSNYSDEDVLKIKEQLKIPKDKKVILYAPTWRDNSYNLKGYTFKLEVNFKKWQERLKDEYIVLFKPHYSSVFFDYAILRRPIYFYMYDLDNYRDELRGFYLDIYHDLPGEVVEDEDVLLDKIALKQYDYQVLEKFNQRFNNHEDGNASKRVIEILLK